MRRISIPVLFSTILGVAVMGCSLAGTWKTVAVSPEGAEFEIETMTFDGRRNYTESSVANEERRTRTGEYKWNGFRLVLDPDRERARTFRGRLRPGGRLVLTRRTNGKKLTATLGRVDD